MGHEKIVQREGVVALHRQKRIPRNQCVFLFYLESMLLDRIVEIDVQHTIFVHNFVHDTGDLKLLVLVIFLNEHIMLNRLGRKLLQFLVKAVTGITESIPDLAGIHGGNQFSLAHGHLRKSKGQQLLLHKGRFVLRLHEAVASLEHDVGIRILLLIRFINDFPFKISHRVVVTDE